MTTLCAVSTERSHNPWGRQISIWSRYSHENRYQRPQLESIDGKVAEIRAELGPAFEHTRFPGASEGQVKRRILSARRSREIQEGQRLEVKHAELTSDEPYR
jgi:hypothetical protein